MNAEPALDMIQDLESGGIGPGSDYATWTQLLTNTQNIRGCVRVELQRFHGRNGMITFASVPFVDAEGKPVEDGGTIPDLNASLVANQLYQRALIDGRRHGNDTYRIQLIKLTKKGKKGFQEEMGEYAGLRFNIATGEAIWGNNGSDGKSPAEGWKEIAEFLSTKLEAMLTKTVELESARTQSLLTTVQAGELLIERRMEHAHRVEQMAPPPPSARETNERIRMGLNAFTGTMRELVRFAIWNQTGNMPPREPPTDVGAGAKDDDADDAKLQAQLRDFFDNLDANSKDRLKAKMGETNFAGLYTVLHGDLANFQRNFAIVGPMLGGWLHGGELKGVLKPEDIERLKSFFG